MINAQRVKSGRFPRTWTIKIVISGSFPWLQISIVSSSLTAGSSGSLELAGTNVRETPFELRDSPSTSFPSYGIGQAVEHLRRAPTGTSPAGTILPSTALRATLKLSKEENPTSLGSIQSPSLSVSSLSKDRSNSMLNLSAVSPSQEKSLPTSSVVADLVRRRQQALAETSLPSSKVPKDEPSR